MENLEKKLIGKIILSLLIIFSVSFVNAQQDDAKKKDKYGLTDANYGVFDKKKDVSTSGTQLTQDGFKITEYKEQKKYNRKQKKYSLTAKERKIKLRAENGKDLTFWEKRTLKKIKKKETKKEELDNKYKSNSNKTTNTTNKISSKLSLSIEEEAIIAKKDTASKLTFVEKIEYRKAIKRRNKIERRNKKDSLSLAGSIISEDEQNILDNKENDSTLTKTEKKTYRSAKKKQKKADKIEKKRVKDKLLKQGWTVNRVTGFKLRYLLPAPRSQKAKERAREKNRKKHLTKEQKKIERIQKKYAISDKEKDAYNKGSSGYPLNFTEKRRYKRAVWKHWKSEKEIKKVYLKALKDRQSDNTKKMLDASKKRTKKKDKMARKKRNKGKFWKKFKKKKQYGKSNKRG